MELLRCVCVYAPRGLSHRPFFYIAYLQNFVIASSWQMIMQFRDAKLHIEAHTTTEQ